MKYQAEKDARRLVCRKDLGEYVRVRNSPGSAIASAANWSGRCRGGEHRFDVLHKRLLLRSTANRVSSRWYCDQATLPPRYLFPCCHFSVSATTWKVLLFCAEKRLTKGESLLQLPGSSLPLRTEQRGMFQRETKFYPLPYLRSIRVGF